MAEFDVTWQMTGTCRISAADDLEAKTNVESMTDAELVTYAPPPVTQVIATRKVD